MPRQAPVSAGTLGDLNSIIDAAPEMVEAMTVPVIQAVLSEDPGPFHTLRLVGTGFWLAGGCMEAPEALEKILQAEYRGR